MKLKVDTELSEFERDLLESIAQAKRGEGRVTTPEQIMARRQGRPVGSVKAAPKVPTTIRLSPDVSAAFRAT
ncbi:MAG: BrnA antitoxin family protein [Rhodoferax sp.]|uniref:BrnA antitoxin family protein n=1 Tax=Rhodoferax sp. TaxID=50421 RepID=UPI0017C9908B|nr:BrnA antitoxin family protein [Rhodoferax sp.]NMM13625.1 BrnA antitoxin family protein [Rhodoferax sp.]NMM21616.1 BrnA antitoxin family protein [Rhodoferax sp.]